MKVRIITDVVLAPVIKELKKKLPAAILQETFEEDLITWLLNEHEDEGEKADLYFIHSDQYFHKKPVEWQHLFLTEVARYAKKLGRKLLLSNSLSLSFSSRAIEGSSGILADTQLAHADLLNKCFELPNVYCFDFNYITWQAGTRNVYQYNLGHLYQMPYAKAFATLFGYTLAEEISWLQTEEKKAIILDCDNTLWKGVVGEDGIDGIGCDKNAAGILFL